MQTAQGLNYIEEEHKMFTYIILIGLGKYMYLNASIDQLKKNNPKHFRSYSQILKDTEIHYRRYNMVCYPLHVLTQFLNLKLH